LEAAAKARQEEELRIEQMKSQLSATGAAVQVSGEDYLLSALLCSSLFSLLSSLFSLLSSLFALLFSLLFSSLSLYLSLSLFFFFLNSFFLSFMQSANVFLLLQGGSVGNILTMQAEERRKAAEKYDEEMKKQSSKVEGEGSRQATEKLELQTFERQVEAWLKKIKIEEG